MITFKDLKLINLQYWWQDVWGTPTLPPYTEPSPYYWDWKEEDEDERNKICEVKG